jgi:AraC family transcriptional regulator, ethanolamine operon transcriptional activator
MELKLFHDFEEFGEETRHADVDLFLPRSTKRSTWKNGRVELNGLKLRRVYHEGTGLICKGITQKDGHAIYVSVTNPEKVAWNGQRPTLDSLIVVRPGTEFCCASFGTNEWISLYVPNNLLETNQKNGELTSSTERDEVCIRPDVSGGLSGVLKRVAATAQANPDFLNAPAAVDAAYSEVMNIAVQVLRDRKPEPDTQAGRPALPRKQIIDRAMEYLEAQNHVAVPIADLAAATDVSERTLRAAFQEYFGIGPLRYMKMRQLREVRRSLRDADPAVATVTSIAAQHGIWEIGRFAGEYFSLFNEKPSETLRRL